MARVRNNDKTPLGGDYSELVYVNDMLHEVEKAEATQCIIYERKNDGEVVGITYGYLKDHMAKEDFYSIMQEITAGLTGDHEKDIPYLHDKCEEYKNHKYAKEITRACGRLIFAVLPKETQDEFNKVTENHLLGIQSVIEEAQFNVYQKRFNVAKELLVSAVEKVEKIGMYQDDAVSEYHTFNEPMEDLIYKYRNQPEKTSRQAPEPRSDLYLNLGSVLFELGDMEAAKVALEKAMRWNPINAPIAFEHAEIYKKKGDMGQFFRLTMQIFPNVYRSKHLARCYRNLGYYFVEKKLWKVAASCLLLSIHYDKENPIAQSELWFIQQNAGADFSMPSNEEIETYARQYNIPLGADRDVVDIAIGWGEQTEKAGQIDAAKYFYNIAYDLTDLDEIKERLDALPEEDGD